MSQSQHLGSDLFSDFSYDRSSPPIQLTPSYSTPLSNSNPTAISFHEEPNHLPSTANTESIRGLRYYKYPTPQLFPDQRELSQAREQFTLWWRKTSIGEYIIHHVKEQIHWGAEGRRSRGWDLFIEIAEIPSGKPKVCCHHCKTVMNHPSYRRTGTKSMNAHPDSSNCGRHKPKPNNTSQSTHRAIASLLERGKVSHRILTMVRCSTHNKEE